MKASLAYALVLLQLATAALVVVLLMRRNETSGLDTATQAKIDELSANFNGSIHQIRTLVNSLELLRQQAASRGRADPGPAQAAGPNGGPPPEDGGTAAPAPTAKPAFPEAAAAIHRLKELDQSLRKETKSGSANLRPLQLEREKAKGELINRGNEAVFVVAAEIDLQPFEPARDAHFDEYLLTDVVPAFAALAKAEAFRIARGALVRSTNEPYVKFAAATALQKIDDRNWVKDVTDVIALGSPAEENLRAQLLGLFAESPRPEATEICRHLLEDARFPATLRSRAVTVLEKQDSPAVNGLLRTVLFEEPAPLLKNLALDALWARLKDPAERKKLLDEVLATDPARMPESLREKATGLLKELDAK